MQLLAALLGRSFLVLLCFLPSPAFEDVLPAESDALIVIGIQREDALEDLLRFRSAPELPQAEPVSMQAAKVRAIVDSTPEEHAVEARR
jgi:hypothetical protein